MPEIISHIPNTDGIPLFVPHNSENIQMIQKIVNIIQKDKKIPPHHGIICAKNNTTSCNSPIKNLCFYDSSSDPQSKTCLYCSNPAQTYRTPLKLQTACAKSFIDGCIFDTKKFPKIKYDKNGNIIDETISCTTCANKIKIIRKINIP